MLQFTLLASVVCLVKQRFDARLPSEPEISKLQKDWDTGTARNAVYNG